MTTQPTANKFRLVATLDGQLSRRDREKGEKGRRELEIIRRNYNTERGQEESFQVQTISSFDQSFGLQVRLAPTAEGRDLLHIDQVNKLIVVEGELVLENDTDRRYAQDVLDEGRRIRTITLNATTIRLATDGDKMGCDVWLKGRVAQPPRMLNHPQIPGVQVAVTTLLVETVEGRPGTRAFMTKTAEINVAVPLNHPHSTNMMCVGNQVDVEGMLEIVTVRAGGEIVTKVLDTLQEGWQSRQDELGTMKDAERIKAEGQFRRDYRSRATERRTRVVVGFAELLDGRAVDAREAQDILRRSEQDRRRGRNAYQQGKSGTPVAATEPTPATDRAPRPPRRRRGDDVVPATDVPAIDRAAMPVEVVMESTVVLEPVFVGEATNGHLDN